jgi:hypothetical protein
MKLSPPQLVGDHDLQVHECTIVKRHLMLEFPYTRLPMLCALVLREYFTGESLSGFAVSRSRRRVPAEESAIASLCCSRRRRGNARKRDAGAMALCSEARSIESSTVRDSHRVRCSAEVAKARLVAL